MDELPQCPAQDVVLTGCVLLQPLTSIIDCILWTSQTLRILPETHSSSNNNTIHNFVFQSYYSILSLKFVHYFIGLGLLFKHCNLQVLQHPFVSVISVPCRRKTFHDVFYTWTVCNEAVDKRVISCGGLINSQAHSPGG